MIKKNINLGADAYQLIRDNPRPFKIILKTKNESSLIEKWVKHHEKIVGLDSLIILDNKSTLQKTHEIYNSLDKKLQIFTFDGFHNSIQNYKIHTKFIDSLRESSSSYVILDTDEFLFCIRDDKRWNVFGDIEKIVLSSTADAIPCMWLYNSRVASDQFLSYGLTFNVMEQGILWGKPILSSRLKPEQLFLHNAHLHRETYGNTIEKSLIIAHLSTFDPMNRVRSNLEKIKSRKLVVPEDISSPDFSRHIYELLKNKEYDQVSRWLVESLELMNSRDEVEKLNVDPRPGEFLMESDGLIKFSSVDEESRYFSYRRSRVIDDYFLSSPHIDY